MSILFGGGKSNASSIPKYTALQVQTSALGVAIAVGWGKFRLAPNVIWAGDFKRKKVKQGGKGGVAGGKGAKSYKYSTAVILALCEGPIQGVERVWADQTTTTLAKLGLTIFDGTAVQAPWPYLVTNHPDQALAYARTAYLATGSYSLGTSPSLPNHNFEVVGNLSGSVPDTVDANAADIVDDYLTNPQYGFPAIATDAASLLVYKQYCQAQRLLLSPLLQQQEQVGQTIDRWATLTNSWIFWSGSALKFIPLGDSEVTDGHVTYTPDLSVAYDLSYADFVGAPGSPPVSVARADAADCPNHVSLEVLDRVNAYNAATAEWLDQALVDQFGRVDANVTSAHDVCDLEVAGKVAALIGQRQAYIRNIYTFKLGSEFSLLEPGDFVTLTDPLLSLDHVKVRITQLDENDDDTWDVTAEAFPGTVGTVNAVSPASSTNTTVDGFVDPGNVNPPAIFEPNADFTLGQPQLWIAASGGVDWGGCLVYVSFDGNEYTEIGIINSAARQGALIASLPSHADPDTVNTLSVDLEASDGVLQTSVTHADADALRSLCLVTDAFTVAAPANGELLAYGAVAQGATPNDFDLTYLRRGAYGTTIATHGIGSFFTLLDLDTARSSTDNSLLIWPLPKQYIGQTIYLKLASFNIFNEALQELSDIDAYTYTPTGTGYGTGAAGVPSAPTGVTANTGPGGNVVKWNANPSADNVQNYTVYAAPGLSQPFSSAVAVGTISGLTYTHTNLTAGAQQTYYVVATNRVGDSTPSAAVNATSASSATFPAGSAGSPGLAVTGDLDTGLYSPGADQLGASVGGVSAWLASATSVTFNKPIGIPAGSLSLFVVGDTDTGIEAPTADQIAIKTGNVRRFTFDTKLTIIPPTNAEAVQIGSFAGLETFNGGYLGFGTNARTDGSTAAGFKTTIANASVGMGVISPMRSDASLVQGGVFVHAGNAAAGTSVDLSLFIKALSWDVSGRVGCGKAPSATNQLDVGGSIAVNDNVVANSAGSIVGLQAPTVTRVTPVTGFSNTIANGIGRYLLTPAGTLATGTITMPAAPVDGQTLKIFSSQTITALTMNGNTGQTLLGGLTTIAANGFAEWTYVAATTTWYRSG